MKIKNGYDVKTVWTNFQKRSTAYTESECFAWNLV